MIVELWTPRKKQERHTGISGYEFIQPGIEIKPFRIPQPNVKSSNILKKEIRFNDKRIFFTEEMG